MLALRSLRPVASALPVARLPRAVPTGLPVAVLTGLPRVVLMGRLRAVLMGLPRVVLMGLPRVVLMGLPRAPVTTARLPVSVTMGRLPAALSDSEPASIPRRAEPQPPRGPFAGSSLGSRHSAL